MGNRSDENASAEGASGFVEVGLLERLPPGTTMKAAVAGTELSVVNIDGRLFAIGDLCLRCGGSLAAGRPGGPQLVCCRCGWCYDLVEGCVAGLPALHVETHAVRVDGGRIYVAVGTAPSRTA
jgi:nitrite reductase (NADH) small subunit